MSASRDTLTIYPWNSKNKIATESDIQAIFETIGIASKITIGDITLYQRAFCHSSYVEETADQALSNHKKIIYSDRPLECIPFQKESYENLEFLGDRVIELCVVWYLYERFPTQDEGFKTKIKTKLVNTDFLANIALKLGLEKHLILSKHVDEVCDGRRNRHILEDCFESFVGALFLDQSKQHATLKETMGELRWKDGTILPHICPAWTMCHAIVTRLIESCMDLDTLVDQDTNYKDQLLQKYQQLYGITPVYKEMAIEGPPHSRLFVMGVCAPNGSIMARGKANSKKKAEQMASKKALEMLQKLTP